MVTKAEEKEIEKIVNSKLLTYFIIFLAIITGVWGFTVWGIYTKVKDDTQKFIASQFDEPKIKATLEVVATNEAKDLIQNTINPEISKQVSNIKNETEGFKKYIHEIKSNYSKQLDELSIQINFLKQRDELTSLADEAISFGKSETFEKLENYPVAKNLETAKLAEILRVKDFYATTSRVKGLSIVNKDDKTGQETTDNAISTANLIKDLFGTNNSDIRTKIVELLGTRKQKGVPEVLLKAAETDPILDVRKTAIVSFENISSGFIDNDVFGYQEAQAWWDKNKSEKEKELGDLK